MSTIKAEIPQSQTERNDEFEIVRLKNSSSYISNILGLIITPNLRNFLLTRKNDYDLIHIHEHITYQNILVYKFAKKYKIPYIHQAHGSLPKRDKFLRKWFFNFFFGFRLLNGASKVIALNQGEVQQYRNIGIPKEKIAVIPNGINLSEYTNLPSTGSFKRKINIPKNEKIVLYLGRIHWIKGIDILVNAFANIATKLNDVTLIIAGPNDGYLNKIQTMIKAHKIENRVLILGPLYARDKLAAFVDANVFVLPSRYEAFPITVLEAVACKTPIILTENCGAKEFFRSRVGLVVKPDSKLLSEKLFDILTNDDLQSLFKENSRLIIKK
jgi:glycosyltransferase involved in cell wall biosynthesis